MSKEEAIEVINSLTGKDFPQEREASIKRQYQIAEALMMGINALRLNQDMDSAYAHGYTEAEAQFHEWKKEHGYRWIPIPERYTTESEMWPEEGKAVLVTDWKNDVLLDHVIEYVDGIPTWFNTFAGGNKAWMPLPEPYEGDDEE